MTARPATVAATTHLLSQNSIWLSLRTYSRNTDPTSLLHASSPKRLNPKPRKPPEAGGTGQPSLVGTPRRLPRDVCVAAGGEILTAAMATAGAIADPPGMGSSSKGGWPRLIRALVAPWLLHEGKKAR